MLLVWAALGAANTYSPGCEHPLNNSDFIGDNK